MATDSIFKNNSYTLEKKARNMSPSKDKSAMKVRFENSSPN